MEPFRLNTNYIDIWAYDLADGINKRFKTDRIGEVEILRDDWAHEKLHEAEALDALRIHGNDPVHVAIRMDMVARNLLLEEYPMMEKGLRADGDAFIWEGDVNGMDGIGRFVLGLPDRIEILEGEGIREYLRAKSDAFFALCQKVTK